MIRIGLEEQEKRAIVSQYVKDNDIRKVFVFYPEKFPLDFNDHVEVEHVEYADIIMYKYFYRLLEEIEDNTLLIFNECMRTRNRSDLTYNCAHHYCNQTEHKIVFEYFPFIEEKADFMILLDFINKGKYKGKTFSYEFLFEEDVKAKPAIFSVENFEVAITEADIKKYEKKKESLFKNLGESDPNIIPRHLHIWAGGLKKDHLVADKQYIARNKRFNMANVTPYKEAQKGEYILIDMPYRRIDFNDFLKKTGMRHICFINSTLNIDKYYLEELKAWVERLGEFYAEASLYS